MFCQQHTCSKWQLKKYWNLEPSHWSISALKWYFNPRHQNQVELSGNMGSNLREFRQLTVPITCFKCKVEEKEPENVYASFLSKLLHDTRVIHI